MARGPDPNRWQPTDPETPPREPEEAQAIGSTPTSRLGLSSWVIALIAILIALVVIFLLT